MVSIPFLVVSLLLMAVGILLIISAVMIADQVRLPGTTSTWTATPIVLLVSGIIIGLIGLALFVFSFYD